MSNKVLFIDESTHLAHWGTKGQKWGVRNWQNYDGTFNDAGKLRYFGKKTDASDSNSNRSGRDLPKTDTSGRKYTAKDYAYAKEEAKNLARLFYTDKKRSKPMIDRLKKERQDREERFATGEYDKILSEDDWLMKEAPEGVHKGDGYEMAQAYRNEYLSKVLKDSEVLKKYDLSEIGNDLDVYDPRLTYVQDAIKREPNDLTYQTFCKIAEESGYDFVPTYLETYGGDIYSLLEQNGFDNYEDIQPWWNKLQKEFEHSDMDNKNVLVLVDRSAFISHAGIKGMKWGVRNWQNYDGTFNEAGKLRYFGTTPKRGDNHAANLSDEELSRAVKRMTAEFNYSNAARSRYETARAKKAKKSSAVLDTISKTTGAVSNTTRMLANAKKLSGESGGKSKDNLALASSVLSVVKAITDLAKKSSDNKASEIDVTRLMRDLNNLDDDELIKATSRIQLENSYNSFVDSSLPPSAIETFNSVMETVGKTTGSLADVFNKTTKAKKEADKSTDKTEESKKKDIPDTSTKKDNKMPDKKVESSSKSKGEHPVETFIKYADAEIAKSERSSSGRSDKKNPGSSAIDNRKLDDLIEITNDTNSKLKNLIKTTGEIKTLSEYGVDLSESYSNSSKNLASTVRNLNEQVADLSATSKDNTSRLKGLSDAIDDASGRYGNESKNLMSTVRNLNDQVADLRSTSSNNTDRINSINDALEDTSEQLKVALAWDEAIYDDLWDMKIKHAADLASASTYLVHYGTKGMKWGVRNWQNYDGTFNEAGKRRYFGNVKSPLLISDYAKGVVGNLKFHFKTIPSLIANHDLLRPEYKLRPMLADPAMFYSIMYSDVIRNPRANLLEFRIEDSIKELKLNSNDAKLYEQYAKDLGVEQWFVMPDKAEFERHKKKISESSK